MLALTIKCDELPSLHGSSPVPKTTPIAEQYHIFGSRIVVTFMPERARAVMSALGGSALVEDKISALPLKPDICALMSNTPF